MYLPHPEIGPEILMSLPQQFSDLKAKLERSRKDLLNNVHSSSVPSEKPISSSSNNLPKQSFLNHIPSLQQDSSTSNSTRYLIKKSLVPTSESAQEIGDSITKRRKQKQDQRTHQSQKDSILEVYSLDQYHHVHSKDDSK
ncbi:hypothetical protein GEMRC1_003351 [Eukaryota sp. GEM-RC1]